MYVIKNKYIHKLKSKKKSLLICLGLLVFYGCIAKESHRIKEIHTVDSAYHQSYSGQRYPLTVGRFNNLSTYMNGIFSDGTDRLGSQAKMILKSHLAQTNRFIVMERENIKEMATEAEIFGKEQQLKGSRLLIT